MKKKVTSMLLSLVLMFTLLVPAMAVEVEQQREDEETITVMSDGPRSD